MKRLKKDLNITVNQIKPTFTLVSGDMVDNYIGVDGPTWSEQIEYEWKQYNDSITESNIPLDRLFELFGNHDVYGLYEFIDNVTMPSKYTRVGSAAAYSKEFGDIRIVAFNPQSYPGGHGPQNFNPPVLKEHLEAFEAELEKPSSCKYLVVTCHYTHELLFPRTAKTKKGNTFDDLLKKHKPIAFMNGHTHPRGGAESVHFADTMELTGSATKMFDNFSITTFDNGRLNYHTLDPEKEVGPYAVISNPSPQHLAAFNFPDEEFPVRVISFDKSKDKKFVMTGDAEGTLEFVRYLPNTDDSVALYSKTVKFEKGIRTIHFSGDLNESVTFAVNCDSGPFTEKHFYLYNPKSSLVGFPLIFILWFLIVLCMWIPIPFVENSAQFLVGNGEEHCWIILVFAGPLAFGRALAKMEIWIKIFVTIAHLSNLFMPICFYKLEGRTGVMITWGYIVDGKYQFDGFSIFLSTLAMICYTSLIIYSGAVYMTIKNAGWSLWQLFFILDAIVALLLIGISYKFFVLQFIQDVGFKSDWAASFPIHIYPILAILIYLISALCWNKNEDKSSDDQKALDEDSGSGVNV